jgi:hypothetical protein
MKYALGLALFAAYLTFGFAAAAQPAEGCVAYGDEKTDFTWRLCPAGEKFERQYRYFGVWSDFYKVRSDAGACNWSAGSSAWMCPDRTIRCDSRKCSAS